MDRSTVAKSFQSRKIWDAFGVPFFRHSVLLMPAKIMSDSVYFFRAQFQKRFVSGHDFSRAAKVANNEGFSPCGSFFRLDSASGPARQGNRPGDTTFAGTNSPQNF